MPGSKSLRGRINTDRLSNEDQRARRVCGRGLDHERLRHRDRSERYGASGHRHELRPVPDGRRHLPSVRCSSERTFESVAYAYRSQPGGHRHGPRRRRRRRHRGGGGQSRPGSGGGGGGWSSGRVGGRRQQCERFVSNRSGSVRRWLHAMHVRQGAPDPRRPRLGGLPPRCSGGRTFDSSAATASTTAGQQRHAVRRRCRAATATRRGTSTSTARRDPLTGSPRGAARLRPGQ